MFKKLELFGNIENLEEPKNFQFISRQINGLCRKSGLKLKPGLSLEDGLRETFRQTVADKPRSVFHGDLLTFCQKFYEKLESYLPHLFTYQSLNRIKGSGLASQQYNFYLIKIETAIKIKLIKDYVKLPGEEINTFKQYQIYKWLKQGWSSEVIHRRTRIKKNLIYNWINHLLEIFDMQDELEFFSEFQEFKQADTLRIIDLKLDEMGISETDRTVIVACFRMYDRPVSEIYKSLNISRANLSLIYRKLFEKLNLPLEVKNKRRSFYYLMNFIIKDRSL